MPLQHVTKNSKPGYRWGDSGKVYTYEPGDNTGARAAKRKAIRQGLAIGGGTLQENTPGIRRALHALAATKHGNREKFEAGDKTGFEIEGKKVSRRTYLKKIGGKPKTYERPTPGGTNMSESNLQEEKLFDLHESTGQLCFLEEAKSGSRVDTANGTIPGVKILGRVSANNRYYSDGAVASVKRLCEGMKVGVDHIDPKTKRRVLDINGLLCNIRENKAGLFGDWKFNPHHPSTPQLLWDADNNPSALGFSIDARGRTSPSAEYGTLVEEVVNLRSVDLVGDPATNSSLFESKDQEIQEGELMQQMALEDRQDKMYRCMSMAQRMMRDAMSAKDEKGQLLPLDERKKKVLSVLADWETETKKLLSSAGDTVTQESKDMEYKDLTLEDLRRNRADLIEAVIDGSDELRLVEEKETELVALREQVTKLTADHATALAALQEKVNIFEARDRQAQVEREIQEDLEKVGMVGIYRPSDTFYEILREAKDRPARQAIIKDRSDTIARVTHPASDLPIPICESRQQQQAAQTTGRNTVERVGAWRE